MYFDKFVSIVEFSGLCRVWCGERIIVVVYSMNIIICIRLVNSGGVVNYNYSMRLSCDVF